MKKSQLLVLTLLILGVLFMLFWFSAHQSSFTQGELRAAIDMGSGATNLKIAKVNTQTNKIVSELVNQSIPVAYQKHLEQSSNNTFDPEIMRQGIQAISQLKKIADDHQVKKVIAVATAAFRKANNAQAFAEEIMRATGVQVRIINQDEEGILAFRGALALSSAQPEEAVVWDIGGGSMQLTTLTPEGTYFVDKGKTASIPFKNAVIQQIKHQNLQSIHSPNPMTVEEMQAAINYSARIAQNTHPFIKEKIQDPQTQILAVGNLFNYGIKPLVNQKFVSPNALEEAVMKWANKTDADLPGGALAEVAVTNPLLVLGYMKSLQIPKVEVVNVNNTDGALTYPPYWQ